MPGTGGLRHPRSRGWRRVLACSAAGMGVFGVCVGAAGAHLGGGGLASTASTFLLIHAAAVFGLLAFATSCVSPTPFYLAATLLVAGAAVFSGDLSAVAFAGRHIVTGLAPTGGVLLIVGWLIAAGGALRDRGPM